MTRLVDYGHRDNRGRTSPSLLRREGPGGPTPQSSEEAVAKRRRQTAITTVRRLGHVANVAVGALVDNARQEGDHTLAEDLNDALGGVVEALLSFDLVETEVDGEP